MQKIWNAVVIGVGTMGRHHARILSQLPHLYRLQGVYDEDRKQAEVVAAAQGCHAFGSLAAAIDRAEVVVVATPTVTHRNIALFALEAQKHLFIEKPIADTTSRAREIQHAADRYQCRVGVGHTERFNPVTRWLLSRLEAESVLSVNIERIGPRPPRIKDVGIVTELAVHDLDLIKCFTGASIDRVRCVGRSTNGGFEDVAQIVISTNNGAVGAINTNWLTPFKSRVVTVATKRLFLVGDLMRFKGHVYAYLDPGDTTKYSVEEAVVKWCEPLVAQAEAFHDYLAGNDASGTVSIEDGLEALSWVEKCLSDLNS